MYVVMIRYTDTKWQAPEFPWEFCYGIDGDGIFSSKELEEAITWRNSLAQEFKDAEGKPEYMVMKLSEVHHA